MTPLPMLSAPARRALASVGIEWIEDVAKFTRQQILDLHGIGQNTILPIDEALRAMGLDYRA